MMNNDVILGHDRGVFDDTVTNDETEILCCACGFSSECVPEGMLMCPNCLIVSYCSVECRDWAWTGGHKNICQTAVTAATTSNNDASLPTLDGVVKSHDSSSSTTMKNDSGKLGESFSDGSVSVASSIEPMNLFDKKPSPFFSKSKFAQFTQASKSCTSLPKQQPLTKPSDSSVNSIASDTQNISKAKRGPNVTKTLGNHFNGNTPNQNPTKQLFVVSTDDESEDDKNGTDGDDDHGEGKGSNAEFDYMEEQSVGMSVLEVESVANLTAIVEESSNLMSTPVIEASWRRNSIGQRNNNPDRLNSYLVRKPSDDHLDMEDSEIIGTDAVADFITMQHQQQYEMSLLQQQDDLAYGVKTHVDSESISSLMGNHNSAMLLSVGSGKSDNSDEEELSYSQASVSSDSNQEDDNTEENDVQQPDIVESSNSSNSVDYPTNGSGTVGHRPVVVHSGPSLRGFRDAYNECDTVSMHSMNSHSIARSLSSSEDSINSDVDAADDVPQRMLRSSSSLKDFRDIYNAELNNGNLLREPSADSLGCSASFDFNVAKPVSLETNNTEPVSTKNDVTLSTQLEFITITSERSLKETNDEQQKQSPTRSEDTSSLQMARMRNESMKHSLNSALRVYEEMYGEDAAKEVFHQLTTTVESNVQHQKKTKDDQTFEWKRTDTVAVGNHMGQVDIEKDDGFTSKSVPKYMQYRTSLSSTKINDSVTSSMKLELQSEKAESIAEQKFPSTAVPFSGSARYLQYRDKLQKDTSVATKLQEVEKGNNTLPKLEIDASGTILSFDPLCSHELKSNSNQSFTVNSSSDEGYQPMGSLSTQMIVEVDVKELTAIPSKPQTQHQFSQRYLQYRQSMVNPMISGNINSLPTSIDNGDETTTSLSQSKSVKTSKQVDGTLSSRTAADGNDENHKAVAPLHSSVEADATTSIPVSENMPRYLSYRLALGSLDSNDCLVNSSKNSDVEGDVDKIMTQIGNDSINSREEHCNTLSDASSLQQNVSPPSDVLGSNVLVEEESSKEANDKPLQTYPAIVNTDAFRSAFNDKYKQYRSSLLSILDSENKEFAERLVVQEGTSQITTSTSIAANSAENTESIATKNEETVQPHAYQIIDLDESTVSSVTSRNHDNEDAKAKSGCGMELIGYAGVSCTGANFKQFQKIWNDLEADQKSLYKERDHYKVNVKAVSPPTIAQKEKLPVKPQLLSVYTVAEVDYKRSAAIPDITMDVETGLFPSNLHDACFDEEMKSRSTQFHQKKRFCYCLLVFVAIALPLGIGVGVGLGRSSKMFPSQYLPTIPSTVPTNSPSVPTVGTNSPQAPTIGTIPTLQPSMIPTSASSPKLKTATPTSASTTRSPTASPLVKSTDLPQSTLMPTRRATKSPSTLVSLPPAQLEPKSGAELLQLIGGVTFDNGTAIQSPGSPQFLAFAWLVSDQNSSIAYSDERIIQRYALASLYFSTDGDNWVDNAGWLSESNECTWHTMAPIENCDPAGTYTNLDLSANGLTGVLPDELALLSKLITLKLSGGPTRFIGGIIPPSLGAMKELKVVDFQENFFFGAIPSELGNLDRLETLDLSMNRLTQTIPTDLGNLTSLKRLNLAVNQFTGEIPSTLNALTQLERLSFGSNNLSGQVLIGTGLEMLNELNLEKNRFTSIGSEIGLLGALETLTMYENALIGTIPPQLVRMSALARLDLHANGLNGPIPRDIGGLSMLTNLDLSANQLSSTIPSSVGSLTSLLKLHLQKNLLEGPLPIELGMLSSAFVIRIDDNNISGSIPEAMCENFGLNPLFYLDCLQRSDGTTEITCPLGTCCSFCCADGGGCECRHRGTTFEFLCDVQ